MKAKDLTVQELVKKGVETVVRMTDKAWLLTLDGLPKDIWFPKSVCKMVTKNKKKILIIPKWLWSKKESEI